MKKIGPLAFQGYLGDAAIYVVQYGLLNWNSCDGRGFWGSGDPEKTLICYIYLHEGKYQAILNDIHPNNRHSFPIERLDARENSRMLGYRKRAFPLDWAGKCTVSPAHIKPYSMILPDHPTSRFVFEVSLLLHAKSQAFRKLFRSSVCLPLPYRQFFERCIEKSGGAMRRNIVRRRVQRVYEISSIPSGYFDKTSHPSFSITMSFS